MEATDENIFIVKQETEEIAHENGNNTCDNTDKVINLSENNVQIKQELFETGPDVYNDNNIKSEWSGVSVPNFIIVDTIKVEFEADTEDNAEATQRSGQQSDGELLVPDMEIHFKEENKMCSPKETIKVEVEFSGNNTETAVESSDDEEDDIKSCSNYQTNCARVAGFVEAKSINLPRIDALMVGKYLSSNSKLIPGDIKTSLTAYNRTMEKQPDEPEDFIYELPLMSEPMEVEDAIIAASKSKAQKQREYRQRIAASRTPAQVAAARKAKNERQRKNRLRQAANLAASTSFAKRITAAPKTRAQIQREYRRRIAASKTPAQIAAAREARNERDRNNRLLQAAKLAFASGSLEATTTSSSRSGQKL